MLTTGISEFKDKDQVLNFTDNSSPDAELQQKNRDQWRKVLGTFDLIKDKTSVYNTKPRIKYSIQNKKILQREEKYFPKKPSQKRIILSSSLTKEINERKCSEINLDESEIIWTSSNEESDECLGIAVLNKRFKGHINVCPTKTETNWSSSNESENDENISLNKKKGVSRCKKSFKRNVNETDINWSSSNESENEGNSRQKSQLRAIQKKNGSECELDLFVMEIEKDIRRTKKIKQKLTTKKGGYVDSFRKAVNKAKADTGFLEYEQRAEIICGYKGVITENKVSYGSYLANVRLEAGSNCFIFLGKNMQSSVNGNTVVCFLDESHRYTVNDKKVYVQPNKVISA